MEDPVNLYLNLDQWQNSPNPSSEIDDYSPSSSSQPSQSSELFMAGFIIVNIVGLQHYSGRISGRELVGLVREPLNPYDPNAIKVLNMRMVQVGHIERSSAAILAPLIDTGVVTVEGIVPNTPGSKKRYKLPCQVHIFTKPESMEIVRSTIEFNGLTFISSNSSLIELSESQIVKEKKDRKEIRSVDEIFNLVGEGEDKKVRKNNAVDPPREFITSELFTHQKEGLGWLVYRENCRDMPPFWEEKDGVYTNVLTNHQTDVRPEPLRGGIFADDMGLGKTLTLLSLIATNRPENSISNGGEEVVEEDESLKRYKGKRGKKTVAPRGKKRKVSEGQDVISGEPQFCSKTTLVVCPPVVFSTWVTQLGEHTKKGCFKVCLYYGERTKDVRELQKYDIVLTTYSTLAAELNSEDSPVKKMEWFRIILDEAHLIKNAESQQSKAVVALKSKRRWVVTGTPIQNGSLDLFSLMAFLKFEPFSVKSYWLNLVQRPLSQGNGSGLSRLQILMAAISLRRVKDSTLFGLPLKTIETCFLDLSDQERELYDQMESEARTIVQAYMNVGSAMRNYSTVLSIILRLRQICDDVALYPDIKSILPSGNIEDVSNNPELLKKLVAMLQEGDDFDCPICISPPTNTVITRCAHVFCRACILKALKRPNPSCPLCRQVLSEVDLFSAPPPEPSDDVDTPNLPSSREVSSKVSTLLKLLIAERDKDSSTKSVIFSQFRKMLILLEEPLKAAGFIVLRLDGSMSAKKRADVITEFSKSDAGTPTVLLASLKASGAGINLTAASRVYLLEPWWNPAVEDQAMDRIHRIGQTKDVKIVRMITRNSIEERVLELQDKKKELAREAFRKRNGKDTRQIGVEDLRVLMAL